MVRALARPIDEPTDPDLLRGCRSGDPDAWDALVRRYDRLVYSVALRTGLRPPDAADVVQSTFIALLEACGQLRDDERLSAWLITVARRKAWRVLRRSTREAPLAELPEQVGEGLSWEDIGALHDAVLRLPQPCRDLLQALYFDPTQPSYAQIARQLDRSAGGIGPMRGRCLERIRALWIEGDA